MIFDTHTDILYHIVNKRLRGQRGVVESYHIPELLEGNVTGGDSNGRQEQFQCDSGCPV